MHLLPATDPLPALQQDIVTLLHADGAKEEFARLLTRVHALPDGHDKERLLDSTQKGIVVRDRLEHHQTRERGLMALIETAQDLTALRDIDQVLQAIVQRARKLIGCDLGYLSLVDHEHGDFYVRATDGAFSEKFKRVRVSRDVGICGFVARNRAPYCSSDYESDSRFAHNKFIDAAVTEEDIRSILGVPLLSGDVVIGVLFVGDRYVRTYNAWEMSILSTLAIHACVAIENARLFEQARQALRQASEANANLEKQRADTQNAADAHERLTSLVAKGGGLRDICDMVAAMLDGDVMVIDEGEQEICRTSSSSGTSNTRQLVNDRRQFDHPLHLALGESRVLGRSVGVAGTAGSVWRVSAVVGGHGLLGGLIIHTAAELNDVAVRIFERSSVVAGVVLLTEENTTAAARKDLPQLLRNLVSRARQDTIRNSQRAARHGLDLSRPLQLLLLQVGQDDAGTLLNDLRRTTELSSILFDEMDDVLMFLSNCHVTPDLRETVMAALADLPRRTSTGVVSLPLATGSTLPEAYDKLSRCLAILPALGRSGTVFHESELTLYAMLFAGKSGAEIDLFLQAALGGLAPGDDTRKAGLATSLLSYLDHGRHARATAAALDIHINTLKQRLDAVTALTGDWSEPTRQLEIHMALRVWSLRTP
ncbi:MAG: GAF domain-containing protein [Burkholderiaceae bacterium]|jgi:GAF domain-containing protein